MRFPNCTRCNGPWELPDEIGVYRCFECKANYYEYNSNTKSIRDECYLYYKDIMREGDELDYDFIKNSCEYYLPWDVRVTSSNVKTTLPLLDVNITAAKLKLYLLFS